MKLICQAWKSTDGDGHRAKLLSAHAHLQKTYRYMDTNMDKMAKNTRILLFLGQLAGARMELGRGRTFNGDGLVSSPLLGQGCGTVVVKLCSTFGRP